MIPIAMMVWHRATSPGTLSPGIDRKHPQNRLEFAQVMLGGIRIKARFIMAYRPTEKTAARKAALKGRLLNAALSIVSADGFNALTINAVAQKASIATGAVYKHFASKAELCAEVFRIATEKELAVVRESALRAGTPATRLLDTIETFAMRALRGQRLAYALIAEPVDTLVDAERLRYRNAYAKIFQQLVEDGVRSGDFPQQASAISAAALVGVIAESLVGPLSWQIGTQSNIEQTSLIRSIQAFCLRAVAMQTMDHYRLL